MEQAASKPKRGQWRRPQSYGKAEFEFFDHTGTEDKLVRTAKREGMCRESQTARREGGLGSAGRDGSFLLHVKKIEVLVEAVTVGLTS
jgi:hypothetical protein